MHTESTLIIHNERIRVDFLLSLSLNAANIILASDLLAFAPKYIVFVVIVTRTVMSSFFLEMVIFGWFCSFVFALHRRFPTVWAYMYM